MKELKKIFEDKKVKGELDKLNYVPTKEIDLKKIDEIIENAEKQIKEMEVRLKQMSSMFGTAGRDNLVLGMGVLETHVITLNILKGIIIKLEKIEQKLNNE